MDVPPTHEGGGPATAVRAAVGRRGVGRVDGLLEVGEEPEDLLVEVAELGAEGGRGFRAGLAVRSVVLDPVLKQRYE